MIPVTGFHWVMERPDSVSRVAPPMSTMAKTSRATATSQTRTPEEALRRKRGALARERSIEVIGPLGGALSGVSGAAQDAQARCALSPPQGGAA